MQADQMATLTYEYLQQSRPREKTNGDTTQFVQPPSAREGEIIADLLEAEAYPGEAFDAVIDPTPEHLLPAFVSDVGIQSDDVIGIAAPSSQLYDELVFSIYAEIAETGVVITTKYPTHEIRKQLSTVDPLVIDCTPGAQTDRETEVTRSHPKPVDPGDLTALGSASLNATRQIETEYQTATFAVTTVAQLLAHHNSRAVDQLTHTLVGHWRNQNIGGLVHVPSENDHKNARWFGATHYDYVIELETNRGQLTARVLGNPGVDSTWRTIGTLTSGSSRLDRKAQGPVQ